MLPYARLRKTARGWHGFASDNWRVFLVEDRMPEDPIYKFAIMEGPTEAGARLSERYRMREAVRDDDGMKFLVGLSGKGFILALPQVEGRWGDYELYYSLMIPFRVRNN